MSLYTAKIGIDCRLAGPQHAGIGRYVENLVKRLPALAPDIHWIFFFHDQQQADHVLENIRNAPNVEVVLFPVRHYSFMEQIKLPGVLRAHSLDLLHVPHFNIPLFYGGKLMVTIHDLLWHEFKGAHVTTLPAWQYWIKYRAYLFTVGQAVRRARAIVVPAKTIQRTVEKYYPKAAKKITVTTEGIDKKLEQKRNISISTPTKKVLLYVGSLYPHKNIRLVIDALADLPSYELWLVGTRNVFQDDIRKYVTQKGADKQVKFLGYVPDEKLTQMYAEVTALVQPSLSEGFGLTGIEAMAGGVPVLASDIPLFQEIYQRGAVYFNPYKVSSFVNAVKKLETSDRQRLTAKGHTVAAQYSWDTMVAKTVSLYRQLTASNKKK